MLQCRIYKSYRTHGTVENKIKSFNSRFSIFYDSMSSNCDLYHAPSFKKLKAEPFISVFLRLVLFAFGAWYKYPNIKFNFKLKSPKMLNLLQSFDCSVEEEGPDEQNEEDDVGEGGGEVDDLAARLDPLGEAREYDYPREEDAETAIVHCCDMSNMPFRILSY